MNFIKKNVFWIVVITLAFAIDILRPTDSTDKSRLERSGLYLYIDYGTGCQYLAGPGFFGKQVLIPRVDKDGKHVCE